FDVSIFGNQAESSAQYLSKGRPVGIDGRLDWREWDAQDGSKRQAVQIIAESVQFLGGRGDAPEGGNQFVPAGAAADTAADFPATADDDIPF
ncbi:MAG: single-stranded DNA-binding protein, partial [Actinobacteria bacterium]|nr:single-stranded DNA-binding protein [Actinomycetota bacterium]